MAGLTLTSCASASFIYHVDLGANDPTNESTTRSRASTGVFHDDNFFNGPCFDAAAVLPPVTNLVSSTGAPGLTRCEQVRAAIGNGNGAKLHYKRQ